MNKGLFALALTVILQACGGEEKKASPHINKDFSSEIKGLNTEPSLTLLTNEQFLEHDINTRFTGNFDEKGGSFSSIYKPTDPQYTAVILNSSATDFDLNIIEIETGKNLYSKDTRPTIVFEPVETLSYRVSSTSSFGDGDFEINIVELNRESLDLSDNEYLVHFTGHYFDRDCRDYGDRELNFYRIINWREGYMRDYNKYSTSDFSMVYGNVFEIYQPKSQHAIEERITVKTNFTYGLVEYSKFIYQDIQSTDETDGADSCYSEEYADGKIIL